MSAKEAKEIEGKGENQQRQSGQEELSAFFAETASDTITKNQPKVAVKGSILSFFNKKASSPASSSVTANQTTNSVKKTTPRDAQGAKVAAAAQKPRDDKIEWQCKRCTFINFKKRSNYLPCGMCNELFVSDTGSPAESTPHVTPRSAPRSSGPTIKTPQSIVATKPPNSIHRTPLARASRASAAKASPSMQVVVIDEDSNHSPKTHKTAKTSSQDTLVIIDSDDEVPLRKLPPSRKSSISNKEIGFKEMLTFSVSKNSGRITLHYKEDGSSSLINFDVHDVLTEETVDALADAQTTRVHAIATSFNLLFNQ